MNFRATLFFVLIVSSGCAWAEGRCPEGFFPIGGGSAGWEGCAPMGEAPGEDRPAQPREPQWATRWGAIAVGGGGGFGAAADMTSKRKAERKAITQCKATAADKNADCDVLAYYNQCAVYSWGSAGDGSVGGGTFTAVNIARATAIAMEECGKVANNCKIYYSNCSYAQRVD